MASQLGPGARRVALALGLAVLAWVAAGYASFTWQSAVVILVVGLVMCGLSLLGTRQRAPDPHTLEVRGASYWALCAVAFLEWEAAAGVEGGKHVRPTLSQLFDPILESHVGRAAAYLLWVVAGLGAGPAMITIRDVTILGFVAVAVAVVLLQMLGRRPDSTVPTAGECFDYLMRGTVGRITVLVAWWWLGWHFLAR